MTEYVGIVLTVELNCNIPYAKKEGTYPGSILTYRDASTGKEHVEKFTQQTLEYNTPLYTSLANLAPGMRFSIKKQAKPGTKFHDVLSLERVSEDYVAPVQAAAAPAYSGGGNKAAYAKAPKDATGMIKGNTVSNAVRLACHRNDTTKEGLKKAALDVLRLHYHLDHNIDVKKMLAGPPAAAQPAAPVAPPPPPLVVTPPPAAPSAPAHITASLGAAFNAIPVPPAVAIDPEFDDDVPF